MKQRAFDYRLEQNITATRIRRRLEREKPLTYPPKHLSIGGLPLYRRARTPKGLASRDPSQLSLRLCIREGALPGPRASPSPWTGRPPSLPQLRRRIGDYVRRIAVARAVILMDARLARSIEVVTLTRRLLCLRESRCCRQETQRY